MSPEKLVYMANQIGRFFAHEGDHAVTSIADHLVKFWDPRMRGAIIAHWAVGGEGLEPWAKKAVASLAQEAMADEPPGSR